MKQCSKCSETKDLSQFHKNITRKDGIQSFCSQCMNIYGAEHRKTPRGRAQLLIADARKADARKQKFEINISAEWIEKKLKKGTCELTGLPFDFTPSKNTHFNKYAPSLDRIDSAKGYTTDNVRVVLCAVNIALGQYTDEEMLPILKAMITGIENAQKKSITPVPTGSYIQGAVGAELGSVSTPWTWENSDDANDYRGATQGENSYRSAKEGSGNSMGHRGKEVGAPATPEDSQDTGHPSSTVNSAEEFFERVLSKSRELDLVVGATRGAIQQSDHRRVESLQRSFDEKIQSLEETLKELREARYPDGHT